MLEAITRGDAQCLVTWHPDRLTRQPRELEDLIDLLEATGTQVRTVNAGHYDLATGPGRMAARIVGAVAKNESEQKSDRQKRRNIQTAEHGKWPGGVRPFGYAAGKKYCTEHDLLEGSLVQAEADAIRQAAKMIIEGQSPKAVMRYWNGLGLQTPLGNAWGRQTTRRTMLRPDLAGLRLYKGETFPVTWMPEPILDRDTWEHMSAILTSRPNLVQASTRTRLLSGFLYCSSCKHKLSSAVANRKHAYACKAGDAGRQCPKSVSIVGDDCDTLIRDWVIARIVDSPTVKVEAAPDSGTARILGELETVRESLDRLNAALATSKSMKHSFFVKKEAELLAKEAALEASLMASRSFTVLADVPKDRAALEALWDSEMLEWKRALISATVTRIDVLPASPGKRFDPSRIVPLPR